MINDATMYPMVSTLNQQICLFFEHFSFESGHRLISVRILTLKNEFFWLFFRNEHQIDSPEIMFVY